MIGLKFHNFKIQAKQVMASSSRGVNRVIAKCEECIKAGNFYEAHQMYRTIYFRYSGQSKFTEAADVVYSGALTLLQHNQHGSGADLSLLLLDALNKSAESVSKETIDKMSVLFEKMDPDSPERYAYLAKAIAWTRKVNKDHNRGHPDLHQRVGVAYWHERNYAQARYHYVHSSDGEGCAQMLMEFHRTQGFPSEIDMFITQAVLQYLCLKNKTTANSCFVAYTMKHPGIHEGPPFSLPLLNFISLLFIALEGGKLAVFTVLCEKYQFSINRDPSYKEYLDKIGQLFFGVPPPQSTPQGLFGGFLQSMLGSVGSDDEDDDGVFPGGSGQSAMTPVQQPGRVIQNSSFDSSSPRTPTKPVTKPEKHLDLD